MFQSDQKELRSQVDKLVAENKRYVGVHTHREFSSNVISTYLVFCFLLNIFIQDKTPSGLSVKRTDDQWCINKQIQSDLVDIVINV